MWGRLHRDGSGWRWHEKTALVGAARAWAAYFGLAGRYVKWEPGIARLGLT